MIDRLSGRRAFAQLRADGHRRGRGPIRLVFRSELTERASFAFAIPRSVGNAVVRNRTKRRIKAVLHDLDHTTGGLSGGDYLVRITGSIDHWSYDTLHTTMAALVNPIPVAVSDRSIGEHAR
ncbi:MAG: ribonuclease P protein component [Actinomycetota bacterium]